MPRKAGNRPKVDTAAVAPLPNDPTPEAQLRGVFATIPAPRGVDEQLGREYPLSPRLATPD